jgi:hypothetical protein
MDLPNSGMALINTIKKHVLIGAILLLFIGATEFPAFCSSSTSGIPIGVGLRISTLGLGLEAATSVTERTNIRLGYSAMNYDYSTTTDGISYDGRLRLRAFEAHFDWFPFGGVFHISPGFQVNSGKPLTADASVPAGRTFDLGDVSYESNPADPVTGTGDLNLNSFSPTLMMGWGNLVPRSDSHFTGYFEFGVAYQGSPEAKLNLNGSVCDTGGFNCRSVTSDPTVQSNLRSEEDNLNDNLSWFKFYPVIALGFGYKF